MIDSVNSLETVSGVTSGTVTGVTITAEELNAIEGVSGADAANESLYADALANGTYADSSNPTPEEIQAVIDSVNSLETVSGVTSGTVTGMTITAEDLNAIEGVSGADAANESLYADALANGTYADSSNPTAEEIQAVIDAVNTSEDNLATVSGVTSGTVSGVAITAEELNAIEGVSGADVANESLYADALANGTYADSSNPTAEEIQAVIDAVNTSEENLATVSGVTSGTVTGVTITAGELNVIEGVSGADAANESLYADALANGTYADSSNPTPEEIQAVIDAVNTSEENLATVSGVTSGTVTGVTITAGELNVIEGVSGADAANESLYADALANGTYTDSSNPTPEEIQAVIDSVNNLETVSGVTSGTVTGSTITADELNAIEGVSGADAANESLYADALANGTYADSSNPTAEELQAVVDAVNTSEENLDTISDITSGSVTGSTVTAEDLNNIEGVSSADAANESLYADALANGTYADSSNPTAEEIQAVIDSVNSLESVSGVTSGTVTGVTITAEELNAIEGVSGADAANESLYADALANGTYADSSNPTPEEIQAVIDSLNSLESVSGVTSGTVTGSTITADELNAIEGVSGADAANESLYADALANGTYADSSSPTAEEIQAVIDSVNSLETVSGVTSGTVTGSTITADELNAIEGVSGAEAANESLYADALANGTYADSSNPTAEEIQAVIDSVNSLETVSGVTSGTVTGVTITADELNAIEGVSGADAANESLYADALANGTYADSSNPTPEEIQAVVDAVNTSEENLDMISDITTGSVTGSTVTAEDLNNIEGVSVADAANESLYADALANGTYADSSNPTPEEIQAVVDAVNTSEENLDTISDITSGSVTGSTVTAEDLNNIEGVSGADAGNESLYADALANGTYADSNNPTAEEVQAVIDSVNSLETVSGVTSGTVTGSTITADELNAIEGVSGADAANESLYADALANGTYADSSNPTPEEIQAVVDAVNTSEENLDTISDITTGSVTGSTVTAEDLNNIEGVSGADAANESLYADALANGTYADSSNPTPEEIQAVIDSVNSLETVSGVTSGTVTGSTITADELNAIEGVSGANAANESLYVDALVNGTYADSSNPTPEEIQAVIDSVNSSEMVSSLSSGSATGGTISANDLNAIEGVSGADAANESLYADALANGTYADSSNPTPEEIQAVIDSVNSLETVSGVTSGTVTGGTITADELNAIEGVSGADAANESLYADALANGTYADSSNPTPEEIQAVIDVVNTSEENLDTISDITSGSVAGSTVTAEDLNKIEGVSGADAANESLYADALANGTYADSSNPTPEEIQSVIDSVNGLVSVFDITSGAVAGGTITVDTLNAIEGVSGADKAHESLYADALANGAYADSSNPTAEEIQAVIDSVNSIAVVSNVALGTDGKDVSVDQLNTIEGVDRVNPNSIAGYNQAFQAGTFADPENPTAEEIQAIIDRVNLNQTLLTSDVDLDLDGLTAEQEAVLGTLDNDPDSRSQLLGSEHEENGVIDAHEDLDGDGLNNLSEFVCELDPLQHSGNDQAFGSIMAMVERDPTGDWDSDGISNQREIELGSNPISAYERDLNGNAIPDILETVLLHVGGNHTVTLNDDFDEDGLSDVYEVMKGYDFTNANSPEPNGGEDTDGNGLTIAQESILDGLADDADGDGIANEDEVRAAADPTLSDNIPFWVGSRLRDNGNVVSLEVYAPGTQAVERDILWTLPQEMGLPADINVTGNSLTFANTVYPTGRYTVLVEITKYIGDTVINLNSQYEIVVKDNGLVMTDADQDGIDDAVDPSISSPCITEPVLTDERHEIVTDDGVRPKVADYAQSVESTSTMVPISDFMDFYEVPSPDGEDHHEVFDMKLQLNGSKESYQVVLPMADPIKEGSVMYSMSGEGDWSNDVYQAQSSDAQKVMSSDWKNGEEGVCPTLQEKDRFTSHLTKGHHCILLMVQDGGDFDRDGIVNGEVHVSVTLATALTTPKETVEIGRSAGGSAGWLSIVALFGLLVRRSVIALALMPMLFQVSAVNAQATPYVGASVGGSHLSPHNGDSGFKVKQHNDMAYQLFAGVEEGAFTFEGYYTAMGEAEVSLPSGRQTGIKYQNFGVEIQYQYLLMEDVSVYLSSGLNFVNGSSDKAKVKEKHHSSVSIGTGVRWDMTSDWFVRLQLQSYSRDQQVLLLRFAKRF
ncbi:hypothetical protein BS333_20660 [Vibrio azureus]|nr:hypothetical protein BS333_20660 [Vibrio azureus]